MAATLNSWSSERQRVGDHRSGMSHRARTVGRVVTRVNEVKLET